MNDNPYPYLPSITISYKDELRLLSQLHPQKTTGPNKIPCRFLKEFSSNLTPMLTLLFQTSLIQRIVPKDWNKL